MNRQTIFVSAYPKSGSTWLTRLLGDVLDSPTGGCIPREDWREVATEGQDRPGPYVIRKGHFILINDNRAGQVVPYPHRLAWQRLTNEKIVFLVRDPRDICISGAWHWNTSPEKFLDRMIRGSVARCGRWDNYIDAWQKKEGMYGSLISYETLLKYPLDTLKQIFNAVNLPLDKLRAMQAIYRQSFIVRKAATGNNKRELRRNNMRRGIAGDWKNHFTDTMNDRIWSEFGWMMDGLGYKKS